MKKRNGHAEPKYVTVGRILAPHGVRGEVKVEIMTDFPDRFMEHPRLYLGRSSTPVRVGSARFFKQFVLLKLEGYPDRNSVEGLRGELLQIPIGEAITLEEGEHYVYEMLGLEVITDDGRELGEITEVIETGANDVYVVRGPLGEVLLPDTDEVVLEVDLKGGKVEVHLLPGLMPEEQAISSKEISP